MTRVAVSLDAVLEPSDDVFLVDDGVDPLLIDERSCRIESVNPTGALVWQCFDGTASLRDISSDLADAFAADPAVIVSDVSAMAARLLDLGLVVATDEVAPLVPIAPMLVPDTDP